jgi:hypothetical protein
MTRFSYISGTVGFAGSAIYLEINAVITKLILAESRNNRLCWFIME